MAKVSLKPARVVRNESNTTRIPQETVFFDLKKIKGRGRAFKRLKEII